MSPDPEDLRIAREAVTADAQFRLCVLMIGLAGGMCCLVFLWLAWCLMTLTVG